MLLFRSVHVAIVRASRCHANHLPRKSK